ncbi:PIN domain-containing protein [Sphingomonas koreensis]
MIGFLLDTNVISELRRPRPNSAVVTFVGAQAEDHLFISDVTLAKIRFGIELLPDAERRASLSAWLDHSMRPLFSGRTLAITEDTIVIWRLKVEAGRQRGHTFGQPDLFVAVQAEENDLIAVTRDVTHFTEASVAVLDPWTGEFTSTGGRLHEVRSVPAPDLLPELTRLNRLAAE